MGYQTEKFVRLMKHHGDDNDDEDYKNAVAYDEHNDEISEAELPLRV